MYQSQDIKRVLESQPIRQKQTNHRQLIAGIIFVTIIIYNCIFTDVYEKINSGY